MMKMMMMMVKKKIDEESDENMKWAGHVERNGKQEEELIGNQ